MRSAFASAVLPLVALIAALVRWWIQGSGNVYTARDKRFYVEDPDLGWRAVETQTLWLGLEICAVIAAVVVGLVIGGWVIRWLERKTGHPASLLRAVAWGVAIVPLVVPLTAFASGWGPAHARDVLPVTAAGSGSAAAGIAGSIDAPAGRYEVVAHHGTSISAQLSSGGEAFDARFARDITGTWQGDPRDLTKAITAEIRAKAAAVDTGISGRSTSARETYLAADKHPDITFKIDKLVAANPDGSDKVSFRATGSLGFIGKTHTVEVAGVLRKADAATLARLELTGEILLVQADFSIVVKETGLAPHASDFDGDRIPIHVSLVLRHTGG